MSKTCVCFLFAVWGMSAAFANELEIITLKHRSAEEVLPMIRPLLDQDEVANGMNEQLILRTSPRNLAQIKQLLNSIDTAPRRLKISVVQNVDRATLARMNEVSGTVGIGSAGRISVPDAGNQGGANARLQRSGDKLDARFDSGDTQIQDHKTQQLQVIEGGRAFVRVGLSVPVPQQMVIQRPWGTEVIDQTQYQDVSSGFYVSPRIRGNNVMLEISTQNDSIGTMPGLYPGQNVQRAASTLTGRLGEWIALGGMSQEQSNKSGTPNSRSSSQVNEQRNVFIKAEEIVQ
ncbi:MAG: hypothetical protein HKM00_06425 [Gallionella sp.]|nr:hypothetical protein [Gallionella sp.]